jgi:hypothetical protein
MQLFVIIWRMTYVSKFTNNGETFIFKPPVETGQHVVNSLGKLAAIAAIGHKAEYDQIDRLAQETDHTIDLVYKSGDVNGVLQYVTNVASRTTDHAVFTSKY